MSIHLGESLGRSIERDAGTPAVTAPPSTSPPRGQGLVGLWSLVRFVLRRDRVRLGLWVVGLVVLMFFSAQQVEALYGDPAALAGYARTVVGNPALKLFAGPGYGFDAPTVGAVLVNETSLWMAIGCGLMSIFVVNRHTRAEEETERADLMRSLVVGRHAPTAAALVVAVLANVVVAAASAAGTIALGFDAAGTIALCASFGAVGIAFAGVAAVAAQLVNTGRATLGLASGLLGLAFVVRGIGDISAAVLSWLTPFGWGIGVRAFAGERWWTLAGLAVASLATAALAFDLSSRRNLGSGLLAERPGPPSASPWTVRPAGLFLRLQRGSILGWVIGLAAMGVVYGSIGDDVEQMLADNPQLTDYLAQLGQASVVDSYLATAVMMLALLGGGFAVASALRNRSEESAGFAESLLATPVSRWAFVADHLAVTVLGTVAVLAASGLGVGLGFAAVTADGSQIPRLVGSSLTMVPAVLVLVGVATVLFGWLPRFALAAWGVYAAVVVVGIFGSVLGLSRGVRDLSPFERLPNVPAEPASWSAMAALTALAVALMAFGAAGFRRRDLAAA